MKHTTRMLLALMMSLAAAVASGQALKIGAGTKGLSYDGQFQEIQKRCGKDIALTLEPSNGAIKNVDMMLENKINGGWVQADIMHLMLRNNPELAQFKTLMVMHREYLHFIAKSEPVKTAGMLGLKLLGDKVTLTDITQLRGMKIGSSGGGVGTAKQVRLESEIPYEIVEYPDAPKAVAAMNDGEVQAVLIVTGKGADYLAKLGPAYRMLAIPPAVQGKLAGAYNPEKISIKGIADNATPTVSVQGLFVVKEYKTAKMQEAISALKKCIVENLDDIKETTGTHPSWQGVSIEEQANAKWPLYKTASDYTAPAKKK